MRIVGGAYRGTQLTSPKSMAIRPTTDRMRESLFNILIHAFGDPITDARVLDVFSGTGALGLEAVSRGARFALFVDDAAEARGLIRQNIEATRTTGVTKLWRRDATDLGPCRPMEPFSLMFADPPYGKGLGDAALLSAARGGWLVADALCVLEETSKATITLPEGFEEVDRREMGESQLLFLRYRGG